MQSTRPGPTRLFVALGLTFVTFAPTIAQADLAISLHAPEIAELSGERGQRISSPKELARGKAATTFTVTKRNNISCRFAFEGRKLGANANFETEELDYCSTGKGRESNDTLSVSIREHIVGLRVCTSRNAPVRIGGFEVEASEIGDQGLSERSGPGRSTTSSDCDRWGAWSSCPVNFVVTGFVAHRNPKERGSNLSDTLVGVQAVCREVIMK